MTTKVDTYFKAHDHHRLYYESIHPKKSSAILVLIHGLNEHIGRYAHVVDYFKDQYTIYLFDHRGHGRSDGIRSHVEDFNHYIKDLNEFMKMVAENEGKQKIFMIAHSLGGQVLLNYLKKYRKPPISGIVTSSANIRIKLKINPIKKYLGLKLADHAPRLKLPSDIDPKWISHDPKVVEEYKNDPLVGKKISVKLASEIIKNQEKIMELAPKIKIPALMLHGGDDHICDQNGTVEFFENLGSKDKELKIYPGMYHEIFNNLGGQFN